MCVFHLTFPFLKAHTLGRAQVENHFLFILLYFSLLICFQNRHTADGFDIARIGKMLLTADGNPVEFQLGRVGQEYILDSDLRGILSRVVLDANKMIPYQDQELFNLL